MDMIQQPNTPQPGVAARYVERRTMRRAACPLDVTVRQRGRFAVVAATADLTPYGARVSGAGPFAPDTEMWLRMPGIESQTVRVVWSRDGTTGVVFTQPLHTAVFARFLPAEGRMTLVGKPEGPQHRPETPVDSGLSEHRCEERFADTLRSGPMRLTVGEAPAEVRDVSASGLKVSAALDADVGTKVAVAFDGFDAMTAMVVWRRADEVGLSLPPDSLELNYA